MYHFFLSRVMIAAIAAIAAKITAAAIPRVVVDWTSPSDVVMFPKELFISVTSSETATTAPLMVANSVSKVPIVELMIATVP